MESSGFENVQRAPLDSVNSLSDATWLVLHVHCFSVVCAHLSRFFFFIELLKPSTAYKLVTVIL